LKIALSVLAALLATAGLCASKLPDTGQFTQQITETAGKVTRRTASFVQWQGAKFRMERRQGPNVVVHIYDGSRYLYLYHPAQKMAVRQAVHRDKSRLTTVMARMVAQTNTAKRLSKKVGRAKLGRFDCDVYEMKITGSPHNATRRIWVNTDPRFPVAVKSLTTAMGTVSTVQITDLKLDTHPSASLFVPPRGIRIINAKAPLSGPHGPTKIKIPPQALKQAPKADR